MRTLIVSDLHLGQRARHDVLRLPEARARLLGALEEIDRLVLLGDILELATRQPQRPMAIAEPVLREIGRRLGARREVVIVPGNHDGPLVRSWALQRGRGLGIAEAVDPSVSRGLRRVTSWLAPAAVRVSYPGVWVCDGVWATHGHYLDQHLVPESAFGLPRRQQRDGLAGQRDPGRGGGGGSGERRNGGSAGRASALPIEYEHGRGRRRRAGQGHHRDRRHRPRERLGSRLARRPVATVLQGTAELLRATALPGVPRLMMQARLAPVTARVVDAQMRHAGVPAMAHVARRLGIEADWIVFGHVHRNGPRDGDRWQPDVGGPRLLNTGSWLYEPLLLDRVSPPHPYWPGGAVLLEPGRDPRAVGLLDGLTAAQLRAR